MEKESVAFKELYELKCYLSPFGNKWIFEVTKIQSGIVFSLVLKNFSTEAHWLLIALDYVSQKYILESIFWQSHVIALEK